MMGSLAHLKGLSCLLMVALIVMGSRICRQEEILCLFVTGCLNLSKGRDFGVGFELANTVVLSYKVSKIYERNDVPLVCYRCGKPLKIGSKLISTRSCGGNRKLYHKACWEATFY
jgi:hypothetical protein